MPKPLSEMATEEFVRWGELIIEDGTVAEAEEWIRESLRRLEAAREELSLMEEAVGAAHIDWDVFCDAVNKYQSAANPKVNGCRKCGSQNAVIYQGSDAEKPWRVMCPALEDCGNAGPPAATIPEAVEKWNEENPE